MKTKTTSKLDDSWVIKNSGTSRTYKSIMLPTKLQEKVKILATKQKKTIIQFIEELLTRKETTPTAEQAQHIEFTKQLLKKVL